jgi:hypothetical protein
LVDLPAPARGPLRYLIATARTLINRGQVLSAMGRFDEAQESLLPAACPKRKTMLHVR